MPMTTERALLQQELCKQLSTALRTLRVNAGLKQETLAGFLQISRSTYSYYELGVTTPNVSALYLLSQFYGVPADIFFVPGAVLNQKPDVKRVREHLKGTSSNMK